MDLPCDPRMSQGAMDFYATYGQKQMLRKINKPLVEKKRRARINTSLQQLKTLVVTALSKTNSKAKLEKADILEMTVKYIRNLQRQQYAHTAAADPDIVNKYRAGFMACIKEVSCFLTNMEGLDLDSKARVIDHLATALSATASPQAKSAKHQNMTDGNDSSSSESDDTNSPGKPPLARKQLYARHRDTGEDDIVSHALMDSGLGAELDNSILDEEDDDDEDLNDSEDVGEIMQQCGSGGDGADMQQSFDTGYGNHVSDYSMLDQPSRSFGQVPVDYEHVRIDNNNNDHVVMDENNNNNNSNNNNNNNCCLPPITHVFNRRRNHDAVSTVHSDPHATRISHQHIAAQQRTFMVSTEKMNSQPTTSRIVFQDSDHKQFRPISMNNEMKPKNPQVLRVRSGNLPQQGFGKMTMYNALTKPIFQKPYSKSVSDRGTRENLYAQRSWGRCDVETVAHVAPPGGGIENQQGPQEGPMWRPW